MSMDNTVTIVGNVTRDPEVRYLPSGKGVASFGVAVNRSWVDKATGERKEQVSFFDVTAWETLGENVGETLTKGMRVIVTGELEQRTWEKDDVKHSKVEIKANDVAPSLRWAQASVTRNEKKGGNGNAAATPDEAYAEYAS